MFASSPPGKRHPFTFDADTLVGIGRNRGEKAMEEFLAMLAVQLFVLVAERVLTYLLQNWTPAAI